jgi:hypothetical protein
LQSRSLNGSSKPLTKICRGFVWKGLDKADDGSCLVAWEKVQRPLDLGALGILNLKYMSWALQICWLWFEKVDANRSWQGLNIPVHPIATTLFNMATETQIGKGNTTLFWLDK